MTTAVATQQQDQSPQTVLRGQFDNMDGEIEKVLPEHVTLDKFKRIVLTAVNRNPDLMEADRRSLFAACLDAATDGLPPDGRDAALVVFNTKDKKTQTWVKKVQYMPMISGIYKKVRNAGEISTLSSHVVYTSDDFKYWIDEEGPHLKHEPLLVGERGQVLLVYAVCKLKDGSVEIETMTTAEVEEVRQVSRAKDSGPWASWWGEMARKSVVRRLSKRLPMSSDQERLMRRDDSMYDLEQEQRPAVDAPPRPQRLDYKPEPPAQGEDLDDQYRSAMSDHETETAQSDEGPGGEEGTPVDPAAGLPNGAPRDSAMLANLRHGLGVHSTANALDKWLGDTKLKDMIAGLSKAEWVIWSEAVENKREALVQMS